MQSNALTGSILFISTSMLHLLTRRRVINTAVSQLPAVAQISSSVQVSSTAQNVTGASVSPKTEPSPRSNKDASNKEGDCACKKRDLKNTVKGYDRHVIICGHTDSANWARSIEEDKSSFTGMFSEALQNSSMKVKLSGCTKENTFPNKTDVILLPENIVVHLTTKMIKPFADLIQSNKSLSAQHLELFPFSAPTWQRLILTCIHGNRDARCGRQGREAFDEIQRLVSTEKRYEGIEVYGSTHLGGHEFAGTLVIYPECDWYGYLQKSNVSAILDAAVEGRQVAENFRGNGFAPKKKG